MRRRPLCLLLAAGLFAGPPWAVATAEAPTAREVIILNGLGAAPDQNPEPDAFDITVPVVSFATGAALGTVRHEPRCVTDSVPYLVFEDKDTTICAAGAF